MTYNTYHFNYYNYALFFIHASIHSSFIQIKKICSTFVGTSPEFEVALYTIIFLCASEEETHLNINGQNVTIKCYEHDGNLGTAYPIAD